MLMIPLMFTSHCGVVHFDGRPVDDFTAVRAQVALRKMALDAPALSLAEHVYHTVREQALAAIKAARQQSHNQAGKAA